MILLATHDAARLAHWQQSLDRADSLGQVADLTHCQEQLRCQEVDLLLLDHTLPSFDGAASIAALLGLQPTTHIVLLGPAISEDQEWQYLKAGVRGYCPLDSSSELLQRIVAAVSQGELWMRRSLTRRLLSELSQIKPGAAPGQGSTALAERLAPLTGRELEIARLIGQGASNKVVAHRLDITERTVKAHLTEVFRKLGISDRLKLALLVNGSDRLA